GEVGGGDGAARYCACERARRHRYHHVVVFVAMPPRSSAGREAPFGDADAVAVDLHGRNGGNHALMIARGARLPPVELPHPKRHTVRGSASPEDRSCRIIAASGPTREWPRPRAARVDGTPAKPRHQQASPYRATGARIGRPSSSGLLRAATLEA